MPIELSGMDELLARLARTNTNVEAVREKALKKGAGIIRDEIEARTPVRTGNLKDNIVIGEVKGQGSKQYVDVGPSKGQGFYGKYLELGTVKMAAKPFIEPSFLAKRAEVKETMKGVIREAIESG